MIICKVCRASMSEAYYYNYSSCPFRKMIITYTHKHTLNCSEDILDIPFFFITYFNICVYKMSIY